MTNVISRADATAAGLKTYFTGIPCKHGHIAERRVYNSHCLICSKLSVQKHYQNPANRKKKTERGRQYRLANFESVSAWHINHRRQLKIDALSAYGGICDCCNESRLGFLTIDHINGGGGKHRAEVGSQFYRWLRKHNYPNGYRVLCFNCNCAISMYGVCPHKEDVPTRVAATRAKNVLIYVADEDMQIERTR